jgi:DNA polymerase-3 subunit gamma/tau
MAATATATAVAVLEEESPADLPSSSDSSESIDTLRAALINALESQGQHTGADLLAQGEWQLEGGQLTLRLPMSEKAIDLSLSADARRLLTQEASRVCGRSIKVILVGGGTAQAVTTPHPTSGNGNGNGNGARQRAAEDPVVKRMQEKFGAEVRTVIDYRQSKK